MWQAVHPASGGAGRASNGGRRIGHKLKCLRKDNAIKGAPAEVIRRVAQVARHGDARCRPQPKNIGMEDVRAAEALGVPVICELEHIAVNVGGVAFKEAFYVMAVDRPAATSDTECRVNGRDTGKITEIDTADRRVCSQPRPAVVQPTQHRRRDRSCYTAARQGPAAVRRRSSASAPAIDFIQGPAGTRRVTSPCFQTD